MTDTQDKHPNPDLRLAETLEKFHLSQPEIRSIDVSTVRGTRLRFPEANQAAPSFVQVDRVKRSYSQVYTSPAELILLLQGRGLIVEDTDLAKQWIEKVGYYRLKGYGLHFRISDADGKLTERYQAGTRFEALIELYEFDRHLRS